MLRLSSLFSSWTLPLNSRIVCSSSIRHLSLASQRKPVAAKPVLLQSYKWQLHSTWCMYELSIWEMFVTSFFFLHPTPENPIDSTWNIQNPTTFYHLYCPCKLLSSFTSCIARAPTWRHTVLLIALQYTLHVAACMMPPKHSMDHFTISCALHLNSIQSP